MERAADRGYHVLLALAVLSVAAMVWSLHFANKTYKQDAIDNSRVVPAAVVLVDRAEAGISARIGGPTLQQLHSDGARVTKRGFSA